MTGEPSWPDSQSVGALPAGDVPAPRGRGQAVAGGLRILTGSASSRVGLALVVGVAAIGLLGPFVAPHSPTAIGLDAPFAGASASHPLGTDGLGRDVLSRFLWGGRNLLVLSLMATLVAVVVGLLSGLVSGYRGGLVDLVMMRITDVALSIPPLVTVLVLLLALGTSNVVLVGVVGLVFVPRTTRVVRGAVQSVCTEDYVLAARLRGETTLRILTGEILPNITGPVLAEVAMRFTYALVFLTSVNFLGLGVQPPSSDWGLMVAEGRVALTQSPLASLVPAAAIASFAIGATLMADRISAHLSRAGEWRLGL